MCVLQYVCMQHWRENFSIDLHKICNNRVTYLGHNTYKHEKDISKFLKTNPLFNRKSPKQWILVLYEKRLTILIKFWVSNSLGGIEPRGKCIKLTQTL